ncbi:hypothetical protein B0H16DRAFT_1481149 [Mycena metata]|uniref:Uncharacterized protein n=1 Tax=Mycena metata TaxID=1033252 RepID=A0AAD7MBF7_9AGAR|nr:hypothetical protein B0H16DRAFT_1481149 [Mycena metata]
MCRPLPIDTLGSAVPPVGADDACSTRLRKLGVRLPMRPTAQASASNVNANAGKKASQAQAQGGGGAGRWCRLRVSRLLRLCRGCASASRRGDDVEAVDSGGCGCQRQCMSASASRARALERRFARFEVPRRRGGGALFCPPQGGRDVIVGRGRRPRMLHVVCKRYESGQRWWTWFVGLADGRVDIVSRWTGWCMSTGRGLLLGDRGGRR